MRNKRKYYIEVYSTMDEDPYCIQSKWFSSKKRALKFYKLLLKNIDYINRNSIHFRLMSSIFNANGYTEIDFEQDLIK